MALSAPGLLASLAPPDSVTDARPAGLSGRNSPELTLMPSPRSLMFLSTRAP